MIFMLISRMLLFSFLLSQSKAEINFQAVEIVSENGSLDVTLEITMEYTLNGTRYAPAFNGGPIGPTLRVKPGDMLRVTLQNNLDTSAPRDLELLQYIQDPQNEENDPINVTIIYNRLSSIGNLYEPEYGFWGLNLQNIHFHGAGFPPLKEDLQHPVDGGQSKTFEYQIPNDHPPGLTWYHSHFHGNGEHAFMSGLFGFMVIEGTDNDVTVVPEIGNATEIFLLMSEALLDPEGSPLPFFPIAMAFDWISVVNGMLAEETVFEFTQGEVVFFRTASASVEPDITLFWEDDAGPPFLIVAEDGFPVTTLETSANVTIPPGARMEFMVKFETPGTYELRRAAWNAGIQGVEACTAAFNIPNETCVSYDVEQPIATIIVLPSDEIDTTELPSRVPEYSQVYKDMEEMEVVDTKTILMQMDSMFPLFQIPYDGPFVPPGVAFGMNDRLVTPHYRHGEVVAGTCEEWTVMSEPPSDFLFHPFHSHTVPFLVTHVNGEPVEKPFWRDVFGVGRNATIKICFNDRLQPGDYVLLHCHALTHHDVGMAMYFSVVAAQDAETPSQVPVTSPSTSPSGESGNSFPTFGPEPSAGPVSGSKIDFKPEYLSSLFTVALFVFTL